ncbi:hypothetical protein EKG37_05335 [Robertmurraya yapensis]|uniref:Uncharacterized protein n=1 Tax=Bacillus yapensis TaxID=2492960 RepID=A0A3S0IJ47_9BACI|nr:hypothetical protein [Bacillus yapensis]RTR35301.1 hypothetical protein EKG37_05335 [Bacillus yapensis]TKS97810.1 hypothetical protein FAR12_05335 [Bacillus yapensis]
MDENRKKVIVTEILYWKQNKMLPEQYCDYLLALYTEGNQPVEQGKSKTKLAKYNMMPLLLIPVFVFLLYFTELSFDLQMGLSSIILLSGVAFTVYFFKKGMAFQISLVITALLLLLFSVELIVHFFPEGVFILYIVLLGNCLLWLLAGKKFKLMYFHLSGYVGMALIVISMFL